MSARRALVLPLVALMVGCSPAASSTPSSPTASTDTSRPPTASSVTDATGDASGDVDLVEVALATDGTNLEVSWTLAEPLPRSGETGLYLTVASLDGNQAGQLGVKFDDAKLIGHFVFLDATNVNLTDAPNVSGPTITATFPLEELALLGPTMKWSATATADGQDSDRAPEPGDKLLEPESLSFDL